MQCERRIVWAYCIYGDEESKYYDPMIFNIEKASIIGAKIVVHTTIESEKKVIDYFQGYHSVQVIVHQGETQKKWAKALRFITPTYVDADFYFYKDSDSIVTEKEIKISTDWMLAKDSQALIIRDHPVHVTPILAGMFAVKSVLGKEIASKAARYFFEKGNSLVTDDYSYDQAWLAKVVYPSVIAFASVYTSFFCYWNEKVVRIHPELNNYDYIGAQVYRRHSGMKESIPYMALYNGKLLSLPYIPQFALLHGRVRPSLLSAYLLSKIFGLRLSK